MLVTDIMVRYNIEINHQCYDLCWNNEAVIMNTKKNQRFMETERRMESAMLELMKKAEFETDTEPGTDVRL